MTLLMCDTLPAGVYQLLYMYNVPVCVEVVGMGEQQLLYMYNVHVCVEVVGMGEQLGKNSVSRRSSING